MNGALEGGDADERRFGRPPSRSFLPTQPPVGGSQHRCPKMLWYGLTLAPESTKLTAPFSLAVNRTSDP